MDKRIEKAARAIYRCLCFHDDEWLGFETVKENYIPLAKAALNAALGDDVIVPKEPTQDMIVAGDDILNVYGIEPYHAPECYRAMIGAYTSNEGGWPKADPRCGGIGEFKKHPDQEGMKDG